MAREVVAIIPARGGSKGIPRKNLLKLVGKPLLAHTIQAAKSAKLVTRVLVSTDDAEIAKVAEIFGAEVVWRPAEISGDFSSSESALLNTLEQLAETEGYDPELIVFLQCTSPLTAPEDIDGTIRCLKDEQADSAFSVVDFHYFIWQRGPDGQALGINHDKSVRVMRQERELQFLESGNVYVMQTKGFKKWRHRFFGKTAMYKIPHERSLEIDDPVDLQIADVMKQKQWRKNYRMRLPSKISGVILDFDGVFTDNTVQVDQFGKESLTCFRSDGLGIDRLRKANIRSMILSSETSPVVKFWATKLAIEAITLVGIDNKLETLKIWLSENQIPPSETVYVGNDLNDIECMSFCGCSVAVADAQEEVISAADILLHKNGGRGAVLEICDLILGHMEENE